MAITTVGDVLTRVKTTLQELSESGTRWTNDELMRWLNESYQAIAGLKPDASSINEPLPLAVGTKQTIPANGLRLIDVVRNVATESDKGAIVLCSRAQLDATRRGWHNETPSLNIEHFVFDEMDPQHFYVYPPAAEGASIEIIYSQVPAAHNAYPGSRYNPIRLDDSYVPAIVDYILYRAYSKDADFAGNANRSTSHFQAFSAALGTKVKVDVVSSPNTGAGHVAG